MTQTVAYTLFQTLPQATNISYYAFQFSKSPKKDKCNTQQITPQVFFRGHSQIFYQFIFLLNRVVLFIRKLLVVNLQNVIKIKRANQVSRLQNP